MSKHLTKEEKAEYEEHLRKEEQIAQSLKRDFPSKPPNNKEEVYAEFIYLKEFWKPEYQRYRFPFKNPERSKKDFFKKFIYSYPIPEFILFNCPVMVKEIVSGKSFYKNFNFIFTKKEAHQFLNLKKPYTDYLHTTNKDRALAQAILFSKAIAKNFEPSVCYSIAMDISQKWFVIIHNFCRNIAGTRAVNTIDFTDRFLTFLENHKDYEWDKNDWECVLDFLSDSIQHGNFDFVFSSRTPGSLIKLTNEWHKQQTKLNEENGITKWDGLKFPDKTYTLQDQSLWAITQIRDSKTLQIEGSKMHHCVYSYLTKCVKGYSGIYRVEQITSYGYLKKEATMEISSFGDICQVKAVSNKPPTNLCISIVKRYCQEIGLKFPK